MSRAMRLALAAGLLTTTALAPRAHAYVRYKTEYDKLFIWPQSWVPVTAYPNSMKDVNGGMDMSPEEIMKASVGAATAWSMADNACTYLQVRVTESGAAAPAARYDSRNSLVFRTTSWCAPTDPMGTCSYDPAALAITSVFVNKKTGDIRDADIEVNSKNFVWADLDSDGAAQGKQDLQNALTHEFGHLIGLDHTCFAAGTPGDPPLDNNGQPAPDCDSASDEVRATTMFASAIPGDKEKRSLAPDDSQAVCEIYPLASDPMIYKTGPDEPSGCAVAPARRSGAAVLLPLAGILAALGLRRRARGR